MLDLSWERQEVSEGPNLMGALRASDIVLITNELQATASPASASWIVNPPSHTEPVIARLVANRSLSHAPA